MKKYFVVNVDSCDPKESSVVEYKTFEDAQKAMYDEYDNIIKQYCKLISRSWSSDDNCVIELKDGQDYEWVVVTHEDSLEGWGVGIKKQVILNEEWVITIKDFDKSSKTWFIRAVCLPYDAILMPDDIVIEFNISDAYMKKVIKRDKEENSKKTHHYTACVRMQHMFEDESIGDRLYETADMLFNNYVNRIEEEMGEIVDNDGNPYKSGEHWYDDIREDFLEDVYEKMLKHLTK